MTSEMIERVGKAICNAGLRHDQWAELDEAHRDLFRSEAREAIRAMAEPTPAMREAGFVVAQQLAAGRTPAPLPVWYAMVDVALGRRSWGARFPA